jgi:hypothetical protein
VTEGGGEGVNVVCTWGGYVLSVGVVGTSGDTGLGDDGSFGMVMEVMLMGLEWADGGSMGVALLTWVAMAES